MPQYAISYIESPTDVEFRERPDACDNDAPKTIQEMAWTSPIWFLPPD